MGSRREFQATGEQKGGGALETPKPYKSALDSQYILPNRAANAYVYIV